MRLVRSAAATAVVLGCVIGSLFGAIPAADAADLPNLAYVNTPNAPFDSVVRSIRLTDKSPVTALVTVADARELATAGEVLDLYLGDPLVVGERRVDGDLKRTRVTLPVGAADATAEFWQAGQWKSAGTATVATAAPDTIELTLPALAGSAAPYLWIARQAAGGTDDVPVTPPYSLKDLTSDNAGGFGASTLAWTMRGSEVRVATVSPGPRLAVSRASMRLTFDQDAPTTIGDQKVTQVLDIVEIRPEGEAGVAPFRIEIDENRGTLTGYAGLSTTPLTHDPPGTVVPIDPKRTPGTFPGPIPYTMSLGHVAAGARVELPMESIEQGLGTRLTDQTQTAITRRVLLASGDSVFFDGVSTSINQQALSPTGTVPPPAGSTSSATRSKRTLAVLGAVLVALLLVAWSVWRWLRETEWYRYRVEARRGQQPPPS